MEKLRIRQKASRPEISVEIEEIFKIFKKIYNLHDIKFTILKYTVVFF